MLVLFRVWCNGVWSSWERIVVTSHYIATRVDVDLELDIQSYST